MAASKITISFLHCDQGMGTLVKIYDALDRLAHLALFDLGSESGKKKYSEKAINAVVESLDEMKKDKLIPTIDLLSISHQDYDHWSLLPDLLQKIQSGFPSCKVNEIYYGGTSWRKKASAAIEEWVSEFGSRYEPFARESSHYKTPGTKGAIRIIDGVAFRLLCVNVPVSRSAIDIERNATSAVIVVDFAGVKTVIPGDATSDTLGWINNNVFKKWEDKKKGNPVDPCRALGAPHHGALRTIADNYVSTERARLTIAGAFSDFVGADNVIASAGWKSKFHHPYQIVLELLAVKAKKEQSEHDFVWFTGRVTGWQRVPGSKRGIYTTVTQLNDEAKPKNWIITINSAGEIFFHLEAETGRAYDRYPALPRSSDDH